MEKGLWFVALRSVLAALAMSRCVSAAPVVLVEDGKPRATIVVPAEASPTVRRAADEVRGYLEKMSGARVPIAAEREAVDGMRIDVGLTELTRGRLPEGFAGDPERVWIETHDRGVAACASNMAMSRGIRVTVMAGPWW
jgi:ABC-type phosphate/phosphonate transport system substrate-binding protein